MKRSRRQNRRGFTLTEVLLVMAILVMIGGLAVVGFLQAQNRATRDAARSEINTMKSACTQYRLQLNRFPSKLDDLFTPPQGVTPSQWGGPYLTSGSKFDPWGNEYRYEFNEQTLEVRITSAGPDGIPGNEDDIPAPTEQQ